jgi:8-oxo-dGTP pyrophosphatase MutT (NUDIX family)
MTDVARWWRVGDPRLAPSLDLAVARSAVAAVAGGDSALEADRARVLELMDTEPSLAVRTVRPGHLTGSAFVIDHDASHALLLFHHKLQRWLQPGGHADGDTNLAAVALREACEETGIDGLRIHPVPIDLDVHLVDPPREDAHLHLDVRYLVVAPPDAVVVGNDESDAIRWVARADLGTYEPDDGLRRLASRAFDTFERLASEPPRPGEG